MSAIRANESKAAAIFVHGFTGNVETWSVFTNLLLAEPSIEGWDLFAVSYPSSLRVDIPHFWSADPPLDVLALQLQTALEQLPLARYDRIALIGHSMGGLVVQRVVLNTPAIAKRVSHVFCYGTPSAGLDKAVLGRKLKRQARDMVTNSPFLRSLRQDWSATFPGGTPFQFWAVQGNRDEFVSADSSLKPFPRECARVVEGNHLEIVRPLDRNGLGFQLLLQSLGGYRVGFPAVDGARLALELGEFQRAVEVLMPTAGELDEAALVTLALALDGLGREADALSVLEQYGKRKSSDAIGALGGRIKRRWLAQRSSADLRRAQELYSEGLKISDGSGDWAQALYHAINLAFLDVMSAPATTRVSEAALQMAARALAYCHKAPVNHWNLATQGEANLITGDIDQAMRCYESALEMTDSARERNSMYSQAIRLAIRIDGDTLAGQIEKLFQVN